MKNLKNHMNDETRIAESIKEIERIAWRVEWIEKMTELSRELDAKYPDLVELATVPPEEWVSRYPTKVASEFKSRIHPLITEIPAQFRSNFLVSAKAHIAQHWNSEVADMLEKQGVFYTDNAPCTQNHRDDEIRDAVETAFVELETEALPLEKLDELERSAWRVKWNEKMTELSRELDAKYPDLVELAIVPPEEWVSRYPTKVAFDALGERIDAMQSEFKTRLDTLVAEMPAPFHAQFRAVGKVIVKKIWGDEVAELLEKEGTF
ncbi:MAG: hypothetical protein OYL97_02965 [Candidatus Poribacteria bacterium]|nr:hypothetical protein [Candidatus Poribacteria bacterium]